MGRLGSKSKYFQTKTKALKNNDKLKLIAFGHADSSSQGQLQMDPEFLTQKIGSDSYKTAERNERNQDVSRFLEGDFIWTVSDRSEDQREVDGERVRLRFLSQSVQATKQKLWENTGLVISEATFFAADFAAQQGYKDLWKAKY